MLVLFIAAGLTACASSPLRHTEVPAVTPVPSQEDRGGAAGWGEGRTWMDQHEDINRIARDGGIELVLLGDSITQSWGGEGRSVWSPAENARRRCFASWAVGNFGISGDRTQHVSWRIENGNLDGIEPWGVMLLIGTNNLTAGDPPEQVAAGIEAVVDRLERAEPQAHVLLLGVLPRGEQPDDPMRERVAEVNRLILSLGGRAGVTYLDLGPLFLNTDASARADLYGGDFLHLSLAGYEAWGEAVQPILEGLR